MPTIGEIRMFAGNFAPVDWILCDGRALDISNYTSLFSLIGTTYGGDGNNYFNVPDLQSRIPVHAGTASWGTSYTLGEIGGSETNTLNTSTMPAHSHPISFANASLLVSSEDGHKTTPASNYPAVNGQNIYSTTTDGSATASATVNLTTSATGQASPQPFSNIQPYLTLNYIICAFGMYPTP